MRAGLIAIGIALLLASARARASGQELEPPPDVITAPSAPHFVLGSGGHVAFGSAPATATGIHVSAEVATAHGSLALEGRYDLPNPLRDDAGFTLRTSLLGGALVPCLRVGAVSVCAVMLLSSVGSEALESQSSTRVRDAFFFLGAGTRLQWHFALPLDFALRVSGEALAHPIHYELRSKDHLLFRSPVVSMTVGLTLVHAF